MKILIELPTWLGDTIMSTPAIENLTTLYSKSEFTLIGSDIAIQTLKNQSTPTFFLQQSFRHN